MKSLVHKLLKSLAEKKLTLAFAESVTCGLAMHELNLTPGTSDVLLGGVVCYHQNVKTDVLKVNKQLIKKFTAESQEVTDAMAKNLPQIIKADICVAITGLNSDGASESPEKPVGTIFFSLLYNGKLTRKRKFFTGTPMAIKKKACKEVYLLILKLLED